MFNIFLINYPGLTKYSIEKEGGVNHASKKGIVRGRHTSEKLWQERDTIHCITY
jgi:hypothetical protein